MKQPKISIDKESWQKGYETGKRREPNWVPEGVEVLSWHRGYIEGSAVNSEKSLTDTEEKSFDENQE